MDITRPDLDTNTGRVKDTESLLTKYGLKKSSWNNKKHKWIYLYMQSAICSVSTSVIFRKSDSVNATEWFRCWWGYWNSYILHPFLSVQHGGETCQHACSPSVLGLSFESTFVIFESLLGLLIGSFSTIHHQRVSLLRLYRLFKFQSSHLWMSCADLAKQSWGFRLRLAVVSCF